MSWGIIASAVTGGAIAAAVGALIGAAVTGHHRDRRWLRDRQAAACTTVLAEHARIEMELRAAYLHHRPPTLDWAAWQTAVRTLSLTAPQEVADAAAYLTETAVAVEGHLSGAHRHDQHWPPLRDALLDAQTAFINVARASLHRSQRPLRQHHAGAHRYPSREPETRPRHDTATVRRPAPATGRPLAAANGKAITTGH